MRKEFFVLIFGIFLINLALGFSVCIDHDAPTWPENSVLSLTEINENEILVEWPNATDEPSCSGVEYYEVYRGEGENAMFMTNVTGNSFVDDNPIDGPSFYSVFAVDRAGHNEGKKGLLTRKGENNNGGPLGGGGSGWDDDESSSDNYVVNCSEWTECNELSVQTQSCKTSTGTTIIKTRPCDFESEEDNNVTEETNNNEMEQETGETSGFLSFTGDVIQATGKAVFKPQVAILLGAILLGGAFFIFVKRKRKS